MPQLFKAVKTSARVGKLEVGVPTVNVPVRFSQAKILYIIVSLSVS